ncbi:MAG: DUF2905 domain-containing protein [Anaerolineae bacterium]|nr:DUF2905 domain-containing protein [Anaerolineae bacterium]
MDFDGLGKLLIIGGIAMLVMGVLFVIASQSGFLSNLLQSGTLTFGGENFTCIVPIVASIILSIVLTVVLNIVIRFLNK